MKDLLYELLHADLDVKNMFLQDEEVLQRNPSGRNSVDFFIFGSDLNIQVIVETNPCEKSFPVTMHI